MTATAAPRRPVPPVQILAAVVLVALPVLLLVPFHPEAFLVGDAFRATPWWLHALVWDGIEWGGNIAAFSVFAIALSVFVRNLLQVAAIAIAVSAVSELAQSVIPNRVSSFHDVLLNAFGALLGVLAVGIVRAVRNSRDR